MLVCHFQAVHCSDRMELQWSVPRDVDVGFCSSRWAVHSLLNWSDFAGTAAILAVGGSKPTVTADKNGRIGVEKQMQVNLTCDHRIVYGAQAAEFLMALKAVIENPEQLTL